MKLTIATFNVQNKYKLKDYSGIDSYGDHVKELVEFINNKYKIVGKYRFTWLGNLIPIIKKYNETNSIITNKKILNVKTIHLPFFPRLPRIVTMLYIKVNNKKLRVINTHLEHRKKSIRAKQLIRIINILKKDSIDTILIGDFN